MLYMYAVQMACPLATFGGSILLDKVLPCINLLHYHPLPQPKKVKNVSFDAFGSKLGRVHMQRQDLGRLQTRKLKGLKRAREGAKSTEDRDSGDKKLKLDT